MTRSTTETLIAAMRILARDIESDDGVANDAIAEGILRINAGFERWHPDPADVEHTGSTLDPVLSYRGLWESINGAGSWAANPWVWCVEFKRVTP